MFLSALVLNTNRFSMLHKVHTIAGNCAYLQQLQDWELPIIYLITMMQSALPFDAIKVQKPKMLDGQDIIGQHYPPTESEIQLADDLVPGKSVKP